MSPEISHTNKILNAAQQRILDLTSAAPRTPLAIVAGPGTGKTEILILRAQALLEAGVSPSDIACITFTHAGAREMLSRLVSRTGIPQEKWHVHTFHSFFIHILVSQVHAPTFRFVSPRTWQHYFRHIFLPYIITHRPLTRVSLADLCKLALEILTSHHRWLRQPPDDPLLLWITHTLRDFYETAPCPTISVTDLECYFWIKLLQGKLPLFTHDHILIDEYQDTSSVQYDITRYYMDQSSSTVFVVGDAKQSIYGFRKATVENFLAIQQDVQDKGGHVIYLTENYRSQPGVLSEANVFQHQFLPDHQDPPLKSGIRPPPKSTPPAFFECRPDDLFPALTTRCEKAIGEHEQVAILFRTRSDIRLLREHLPTPLLSHTQSSDEHQVLIPQSPYARGLGLGYLHALFPDQPLYATGWKTSAWKPTGATAVYSLDMQITLRELIHISLSRPTTPQDVHATTSLIQVLSEAAQIFLPHYPYQLENYILSLLDPLNTQDAMAAIHTKPKQNKLITLSTLHAAKGLEFDTVILPINKHSIPRIQSYPDILSEDGHSEYSQWGYRYSPSEASGEKLCRGAYEHLQARHKSKLLAEEMRLLYVGITRARKRLEVYTVTNEIPKELLPWLKSYTDRKAVSLSS